MLYDGFLTYILSFVLEMIIQFIGRNGQFYFTFKLQEFLISNFSLIISKDLSLFLNHEILDTFSRAGEKDMAFAILIKIAKHNLKLVSESKLDFIFTLDRLKTVATKSIGANIIKKIFILVWNYAIPKVLSDKLI